MTYIWINPVTESMYQGFSLDEFLTRSGFIRVRHRSDWGGIVKEKYRKLLDEGSETVADARCPMACGLIRKMQAMGCKEGHHETGDQTTKEIRGELSEVRIAPVEPILIHCAREISGREELKDGKKIITTPCRSLADMGNDLKLPNTWFVPWNVFLKSVGEWPEGRIPDASPIPPGFFGDMAVEKVSLTGKDTIEEFVSQGRWKQVRLMELLYCDRGCHNGDGVVMDEP